jgi:tRNA(Ile)-lysidine synthase
VAELPDRVSAVIREHDLLPDGAAVLVAVSGGCDSMVLLHVLAGLAGAHGWRLAVGHFNHQLRGRASDRDEVLVRQTAERLGLAFLAGRGDVRAHARQHGVSIEMAARRLRHEFFAAAARHFEAGTVAVAHHADDQVETFFLRALRGSGGEGLAGMSLAGRSPADAGLRFVRPLLGEPRAALAAWAASKGVLFREDASNRRIEVPRNFLRRRIVPALRRALQPGLAVTIPRLMALVGDEADFAAEAARLWLAGGRRRRAFGRLHVAVQRRVLRYQLLQLGVVPDFEVVERLRVVPGEETTTPGGLRVWRDEAGRLHPGKARLPDFDPATLQVPLAATGGEVNFGGLELEWRVRIRRTDAALALPRQAGRERFDAARVGEAVVLRHWQPGDRFQPIGLAHAAKLQDLFTNARVPRGERHGRVVAATTSGVLFWVEGLRVGEHARLTPESRRIFEWRWRRGG